MTRLARAVMTSSVPQDRAAPRPVRRPKGIGAAYGPRLIGGPRLRMPRRRRPSRPAGRPGSRATLRTGPAPRAARPPRGDVAQLEEHRVRIAGVRGSSPLISTIPTRLRRCTRPKPCARRASSLRGHQPDATMDDGARRAVVKPAFPVVVGRRPEEDQVPDDDREREDPRGERDREQECPQDTPPRPKQDPPNQRLPGPKALAVGLPHDDDPEQALTDGRAESRASSRRSTRLRGWWPSPR